MPEKRVLGSEGSVKGMPFQIEGSTTEKAHICLVEVRAKGTWRRPCSVEWREHELRVLSEVHRAQHDRQEQGPTSSARPMQPTCIRLAVSLAYYIYGLAGSQCRTSRIIAGDVVGVLRNKQKVV